MFCAASIVVLYVAAVCPALKRRQLRLHQLLVLADSQQNVLLFSLRRKHGYLMCMFWPRTKQ